MPSQCGQIVLLDTVLIMKRSIRILLLKNFEKKDVNDFNH
nr:MAG TPA: HhaI Restriction Endonuclease/DNA Complex, modification, protein-DNA complex, iodine [Caudoviricetes sp.]